MTACFRPNIKSAKIKYLLLSLLLLTAPSMQATASEAGAETTQTAQFEALFQSEVNNEQLKPITEQLILGEHASGQFTQYRHLKVLKKPLVSHGSFIFDSELGLAWKQERPFKSTLLLKGDELIQIDSSGQQQVSKANENQGAGALAQTLPILLKALLSGELDTLTTHFHFYMQASSVSSPWTIGLKPKDPLLIKAIPQLVLEGDEQISALTLLSGNGDSSRIEFEQITNQPLSAIEQQELLPTDAEHKTKPAL